MGFSKRRKGEANTGYMRFPSGEARKPLIMEAITRLAFAFD